MRTIGNDLLTTRQNNFIASGTLDNGAAVIVNANGTVSTVVQTPVSAAEGNVGEDSTSSTASYDFAACYDSTNKKVVAFFNRNDDLIGIVGTISGTTISFGSPFLVNGDPPGDINAVFIPPTETRNAKVAVVYRIVSGTQNIIACNICEVSGTSLSSGNTTYVTTTGRFPKAAYDSDNDMIGVIYRKSTNGYVEIFFVNIGNTAISVPGASQNILAQNVGSDAGKFFITYDTEQKRYVVIYFDGTSGYIQSRVVFCNNPAGGSITAGSQVTVESAAMAGPHYGNIVYDTDQKKVILIYRTTQGRGSVGTVSGTSITWETPIGLGGGTMTTANIVYDSQAKKVFHFYMTTDNNYGRARDITLSGTTLTAGSESVPLSQDISGSVQFGLTHDSDQNTNVVFFKKVSSSGRFAGMCIRLAHLSENLTSENFIGMPESRVGNGVRVSVKTQGAVSKNAFNNGYVITVQNVSGNNKYFIDGVQQDTLYLYRGNTYFFDWSAATTHPFSFSTTSDGTHNSGSEYTTGVTKDNSAYTTSITVDSSAPNTLYYYCSAHSGMGGSATIADVVPGRTYYVQKSGILKTTADTPSVVAGTALSTTELIVKG